MKTVLLAALLAGPAAASAFEPALPFPATPTFAETRQPASHRVATGPWRAGLPATVAEGAVTRRTWSLDAPGATTLEVLAPLRDQLRQAGWEVVFECQTRGCGGFDFRFEIDVTPAPEMYVDLADYRYLAARRGEAWTTLLVSRSGARAHVQITEVDPGDATGPAVKSTSNHPARSPVADLAAALARSGRAVLPDLSFETGSTELAPGAFASLAALADWLAATPGATVALVGHTDAEGGAEGNRALSLRRARSARARLLEDPRLDPARVTAEGLGYFAPIDRNDTAAGREANRRVEVVVTSVE